MRAALHLLLAVACGAFLVRSHWPLPPDLVEAADLAPWRVAAARAGALAGVGVLLALRPADLVARPGAGVLAGLALGVATGLVAPVTGGAAWPFGLAAIVLLLALRRAPAGASGGSPSPDGARAPARGALALGLLACGISGALFAVARLVQRTALDSPADATTFALTFASLAFVGAVAFGRPFSADGSTSPSGSSSPSGNSSTTRGASPLAALVAAYACLAALVVTAGVTQPRGLRSLTRRFGLDVSGSGTLGFDVLVGAAAFVLPAFAVGAALHLVRSRPAWLALGLGAGAGALLPLRLAPTDLVAALDGPPLPGSAGLVLDALVVAGVGALVGATLRAGRGARLALGAGGVALTLLGLLLPVAAVRMPRAFERFQPTPLVVEEGPSGQLLVDPAGLGLERVTLDHRALTPTAQRAQADRDQLVQALGLLPEDVRARGARVLLVAPLSPGRVVTLSDLGCSRVDRSAGYWRDLPSIEAFLARRLEAPALAGEVLAPPEARRRAARGDYDLVVAPAVRGSDPRARFLAAPPATIQVQWLDGRDELQAAELGSGALLASSGAEGLVVGRVRAPLRDAAQGDGDPSAALGAGDLARSTSAPARLPFAAPGPAVSQLHRLRLEEAQREVANERALARRLARGARGTRWADLGAGLAQHLAAQRPSSPFEGAAQRVELDRPALDLLFAHATQFDAAAGAPPDPFTRGLWNGLVDVLRAKRQVPLAYELVEPLVELWAPWPEGALCLAWADLEELEPEEAVSRLEPLVAARPGDRELVVGYSEALDAAGRPADAIQALRRLALALPADRGVRKRLARALIQAGDPEGRQIASELIREDPDDGEAWALIRPRAGER